MPKFFSSVLLFFCTMVVTVQSADLFQFLDLDELQKSWRLEPAEGWIVEENSLGWDSSVNCNAVYRGERLSNRFFVEAEIIPGGPLGASYKSCGLSFGENADNFWSVSLIDQPNGVRTIFFDCAKDGTWPAAGLSATKVKKLEDKRYQWLYGVRYLLRIEFSDGILTGLLSTPGGTPLGKTVYQLTEGILKPGYPSLFCKFMSAQFTAVHSGIPVIKIKGKPAPANWTYSERNSYPLDEKILPLDEKLIAQVKSRSIPKVEWKSNFPGGLGLFVDGKKKKPECFYAMPNFPLDSHQLSILREAGIDMILPAVNIGMYAPRRGWTWQFNESNIPFWDGQNRYNDSTVESLLWYYLRSNPEGYLVVNLFIDDYPEFPRDNPDELWRNEQGSGIYGFNHFFQLEKDYTNNSDPRLRLVWSMHSKKFQDGACEAVRQYVLRAQKTVPGRAIIGYLISGGVDTQLYGWMPPTYLRTGIPELWGDYSKPARAALKEWTEKHYRTISALNAAWKPAYRDFSEVAPPTSTRLTRLEYLFHDPIRDQQIVDFMRFTSEARMVFISRVAAVIREASDRPVLVGAFAGSHAGARGDVNANDLLLEDSRIDFAISQASYGEIRSLPGAGGINACLHSYPINKKYFLADMDHRSWLSDQSDLKYAKMQGGFAENMADLRNMWRREGGRLWCAGAGIMFHPLRTPWEYLDTDIQKEIANLHLWGQEFCENWTDNAINEMAVIFDERANDYEAGSGVAAHTWMAQQSIQLNLSGVPYRLYYASDFRRGIIPLSRCYLFINPLVTDTEWIKQFLILKKKKGTTLILMQGAGYAQQHSASKAREIFGLGIEPVIEPLKSTEFLPPTDHELTRGLLPRLTSVPAYPPANSLRNPPWQMIFACSPEYLLHPFGNAVFSVTDPAAIYLSTYPGSGACGFGLRQHPNFTTVFIGSYIIPAGLIRRLAVFGKVWAMTSVNCVVSANEKLTMVHPMENGLIELSFLQPCALEELPPGSLVSPKALKHSLKLQAGTTYLFRTTY